MLEVSAHFLVKLGHVFQSPINHDTMLLVLFSTSTVFLWVLFSISTVFLCFCVFRFRSFLSSRRNCRHTFFNTMRPSEALAWISSSSRMPWSTWWRWEDAKTLDCTPIASDISDTTIWGGAHYVMVSRIQWQPFWIATQLCPQNDWTGWQFCAHYDTCVQPPFLSLKEKKTTTDISVHGWWEHKVMQVGKTAALWFVCCVHLATRPPVVVFLTRLILCTSNSHMPPILLLQP